jgi:hypothetical protein
MVSGGKVAGGPPLLQLPVGDDFAGQESTQEASVIG